MRTWIEQLTAIPMVCGFERAQSERVRELFAPLCDEIEVDRFGNVIGRIRSGKPDAKTVLLDAHLDQIGFVVTETLDHGFLRFQSVGGVDPRMLLRENRMQRPSCWTRTSTRSALLSPRRSIMDF